MTPLPLLNPLCHVLWVWVMPRRLYGAFGRVNQSPLVQPIVPKEPRKISPRFIIYIAGIKGICMCVYQSLRKIQLFNKFWAIIFQSYFNWKNRITLNNDCIHRRQLAAKKRKIKLRQWNNKRLSNSLKRHSMYTIKLDSLPTTILLTPKSCIKHIYRATFLFLGTCNYSLFHIFLYWLQTWHTVLIRLTDWQVQTIWHWITHVNVSVTGV